MSEQEPRASQILENRTVSVQVERRFNLGDFESLNVSYTLGGELPDDVDPMWAVDDLHSELRRRIYQNVGDEITQREAIAKESFLTTPRKQRDRIVKLFLEEAGVDVDSVKELLSMGIDLKDVVKMYQQRNGVHHE